MGTAGIIKVRADGWLGGEAPGPSEVRHNAFLNTPFFNELKEEHHTISVFDEAAFDDCFPSLTVIMSNLFQDYLSSRVTKVILPNITGIGDYTFSNCQRLTEIILLHGVYRDEPALNGHLHRRVGF